MGKRKREDDEEYLIRKIQRYEDKLRKRRKKRSPTPRSLSSSPYESDNAVPQDMAQSPILEEEQISSDPVVTAENPAPNISTQILSDPFVATENPPSDISTEILELLGQAKKVDPTLGEKIPNEVAERWGKILLDGLDKEHKETLKAKMLVPENFTLVRAPKLNPEIASILSDSSKNRDKHLESTQNQLGTGIAGLVNLTKDLILAQSVDKLDILKRISEISQIFLDLHHEETFNRRKLLIPLLDKNFWNITKDIKRDEFLFGTKLSESIKNSKDIEKSGLQIKKSTPPNNSVNRRSVFQAGNARGPPRRANNVTAAPSANRRQPQPSTSSARRTNNSTQRNRQTGINKPYDKKNHR